MHKEEFHVKFFMCVIQSRRVVRTTESTGIINYATVTGDRFSRSYTG